MPPFPHGQMPITSGGQFHPANFQQMIAQQQMAAAQQGQFIPAPGTSPDFQKHSDFDKHSGQQQFIPQHQMNPQQMGFATAQQQVIHL